MNIAMVGCPVVPIVLIITLPWHGDQIQQVITLHIFNKSSQISRGEHSWSFVREIIESQMLAKYQSHLLQYLSSDVGTPNPHEFWFNRLEKKVVQHTP